MIDCSSPLDCRDCLATLGAAGMWDNVVWSALIYLQQNYSESKQVHFTDDDDNDDDDDKDYHNEDDINDVNPIQPVQLQQPQPDTNSLNHYHKFQQEIYWLRSFLDDNFAQEVQYSNKSCQNDPWSTKSIHINKMRFLSIIICLATAIQANMYFRRVGWINPNPSYGHIHLSIDLSQIETHLNDMKTTLEHFRNNLQNIHHPLVKVRAQTFIKHSLEEANMLQRKFQEYLLIVHSTPNETKRVKRFLGMLLAITSLTMSLFNTAEIMHLQSSISSVVTRQQHITDILQEHEVSIHNVEHNIASLLLWILRS